VSDESDNRAREPRNWAYDEWIAAYEEKGTVTAACKVVGIARETAYQHRRRDGGFREAWEAAEEAVTEVIEKTLVEVAIEDRNVRALEIALKSRRPEKYREGLNVDVGGTVKIEVRVGLEGTIERLVNELAGSQAEGSERPGVGDAPGQAARPALAAGN
jgi:hypothetical protein